MAQPDPYNTMVLNYVAKLKDVGAQLARKSTLSPNLSLYQTLSADSFTSMASISARDRHTPDESTGEPQASGEPAARAMARLGSQESLGGVEPQPPPARPLPPATFTGLDIMASEENAEEPSAEELGSEESAAGEADEEPETGELEDAQEDAEDDGAEDPECKTSDCSDLLKESNATSSSSGSPNSGQNGLLDINVANNVLAAHNERPPVVVMMHPSELDLSQSPIDLQVPSVLLNPRPGLYTPKYPVTGGQYDPVLTNDLDPNKFIQADSERQSSAAQSSVSANFHLLLASLSLLATLTLALLARHRSRSLGGQLADV